MRNEKIESFLTYFPTILLLILFVVLSQLGYLADSEIWSITLAQKVFDFEFHPGLYNKFLFNSILNLVYGFSSSNQDVLLFARSMFCLLGLSIVGLVYLICQRLFQDKGRAILAIIILLSTTNFLNRGFRVRADILSSSISLCFILLCAYWEPTKWWFKSISLGFLSLLLILSTPKAIYFYIAQLAFLFIYYKIKIEKKERFIKKEILLTLAFPFLFAVYFLLLVSLFGYQDSLLEALHSAYKSGWQYFLDSFSENSSKMHYFSIFAFQHLIKFLYRNPLFSLLILTSLALAIKKMIFVYKRKAVFDVELAFIAYAFVLFFCLVFHNDKQPFFIAAILPIFTIFSANTFNILLQKVYRDLNLKYSFENFSKLSFFLFIFMLTAKAILFFEMNRRNNNNFAQLDAIEVLENYTSAYPNFSYYDSIGSLPLQASRFRFVGPNQVKENRLILKHVVSETPDFIFFANKLLYLEPFLSHHLRAFYVHIGHAAFARAITIDCERNLPFVCELDQVNGQQYYRLDVQQINEYLKTIFKDYIGEAEFYIYPNVNEASVAEGMEGKLWIQDDSGEFQELLGGKNLENLESEIKALFVHVSNGKNFALSIYPPIFFPSNKSYFDLFKYDSKF